MVRFISLIWCYPATIYSDNQETLIQEFVFSGTDESSEHQTLLSRKEQLIANPCPHPFIVIIVIARWSVYKQPDGGGGTGSRSRSGSSSRGQWSLDLRLLLNSLVFAACIPPTVPGNVLKPLRRLRCSVFLRYCSVGTAQL